MALRINPRTRAKLHEQFEAFMAGRHKAECEAQMARARISSDPAIRRLFVDYARDSHHEYLHMVRGMS